MYAILDKEEIDELNRRATAKRRESDPDADLPLILYLVAEGYGLKELAGDVDHQVIFQDRYGRLVNCWIGGAPIYEITEGGMGFDDQVEWYTEPED